MLGNELVLLSRSMTYASYSTEKDVCDRILCPMKSAIRRYCSEGNDFLSAKDMFSALAERPVRGTTACVGLVNETQENP